MATIEDLPSYLYCDDKECTYRHFLALNRSVSGFWVIGYVAFIPDGERVLPDAYFNHAETIAEAAKEMTKLLKKRNK